MIVIDIDCENCPVKDCENCEKGMEMPTECGRCNAAFPNGVDYSCCLIKGYPLILSQRSTRLKNCHLITTDHGYSCTQAQSPFGIRTETIEVHNNRSAYK